MIKGMYAATAGMITMLTRAQQISNNIANVNTVGYREDTVRVTSFPQQLMNRVFGASSSPNIGSLVNGTVTESTWIRYAQAPLRATDNPLDMAIQGSGMFAVQTPQGVRYTRDGGFRRDGLNQLVTTRGDLVLDANLQPITLPAGGTTMRANGEILVNDQVVGQVGLFDFVEPQQLVKVGNTQFEDARQLAQPLAAGGTTVRQGYLEQSNVDPARAMTDLMVAQRTYEAAARMVQLQDEMTQRAANDLGRI